MKYYNYFDFRYIWDKGFCICFYNSYGNREGFGYFEDGTTGKISRLDSEGTNAPDRIYRSYSSREKFYVSQSSYKDFKYKVIPKKKADSLTYELEYKGNKVTCSVGADYYSDSCTCGKKYGCTHTNIVRSIILDKIVKLIDDFLISDHDLDKSHFLAPSLKEKINKYKVNHYTFEEFQEAKDIVKQITLVKSKDYVITAIDELLDRDYYYYQQDVLSECSFLIYALLGDPLCYEVIVTDSVADEIEAYERQKRSNLALFKRYIKSFEKAKKEEEKNGFIRYDEKDILKYLYAVVKNDSLLQLKYLASIDDYYAPFELNFMKELAKDTETLKNNQESVISICQVIDECEKSELKNTVFNLFFKTLKSENKAKIVGKLKTILVGEEVLDGLSLEDQKQIVFSISPTNKTIERVLTEILKDSPSEVVGRYLVSVLDHNNSKLDSETIKLMLRTAASLKAPRLLYLHICDHFEIKASEKTAPPKADVADEINLYYNTSWHFSEEGKELECTYIVKTSASSVVKCYEKGKFKGIEKRPFAYNADFEQIKQAIIANDKLNWETAKEKQTDRIAREAFALENRVFTNDLLELQTALEANEPIILSKEQSAKIEYSIYWEVGYPSISFRVGITKFYQVRDAAEFVDAFKTSATISYGKELTLTHDYENFSESDEKIMRILTAARLVSGRITDRNSKKYITLTHPLFASILSALKDRNVYFNDKEALVRLNDYYIATSIDKNYKLRTSIADSDVPMLLGNVAYIATGDNKIVIDKVINTPDQLRLISFFKKHNKVNIKPILNEFRSKIYSHYSTFIEIDPSLKESFKLSTVKIAVNFDYEKGIITRHKVYTKEDVNVQEKDLTLRDMDRVRNLDTYLSGLGFDEEGSLTDDGKILNFFRMDFTRLQSLCSVYLSENLMNKKLVSVKRQIFHISHNGNLMEIFLEKSDYSEEELAAILKALKMKKKFILLKDGERIVDLDNEEAKEFEATASDFGLDANNLYAKRPIPMASAIKAFAHQRNCHVDKYLRNMIDDLRAFKSADIKLPNLNAKLRGYQIEGYNWLSILSEYGLGGILADDMGLGKTLQMIALIKADKVKKPSLIVCPKSLIFNWKSEILKFDGKTEVVEIYGSESQRSKIIQTIDPNKKAIYITSIDMIRLDASKYNVQFRFAVIDEAQYIRNIYAQKTKSVKTLDAERRFALTGTPIENSIIDLWSIFDFIMPGYLEEVNVFKSSEHDAIKRKVAPFILRRTKQDVLTDLPPKYERILTTEMDPYQRKIYEAERESASKILAQTNKSFDVLPYLTRLRQICIAPSMYLDGYKGESAKLKLLETMIPQYIQEGHKILVFSQFVKALDLLAAQLDKTGIGYFMLSGDTSAKKRIEMMNDFNEGSGPSVFLISLKAGGTGLNLIGADTVIHIDPWWNVAAEDQADDRTHRIGQKRNVEVIKLIAEDSIEQRVLELQEMKKDIIDKVISNDDSSVSNVKLEDIAFILKQ